MQLVGGAVAGAYTLGNIPQARSEAISRPDRAGGPYRWVGMYTVGNRKECGFMVSDRVVLTAAHTLYNPHPQRRITQWPLPPITFYPATSGLVSNRPTNPYGGFRVAKCIVCPEWFGIWREASAANQMPKGHSQYDWALLVLDRAPKEGFFGWKGTVEVDDRLDTIGYPGGIHPANTQQRFTSTVKYVNEGQIFVDSFVGDQWGGMSGGPLFRWEGDKLGWCAIGVHSRVEVSDGGSYHCRIDSSLADRIRSFS
jgi:hypothetical protein